MAKGDKSALQNTVNQSTGTAQQSLTNNIAQNQQSGADYRNQYNATSTGNIADYGSMMNSYRNFINNVGRDPGTAAARSAITGYKNFADTGGFSPEDIAQMRNQATAPITGIYQNAMDELRRKAAVAGPFGQQGTAAALADMARRSSYAAGDTANKAMADIAQLKSQNQLYGLQGEAGTGLNLSNALAGQKLSGMGGMSSLYGTTPALTATFGNMVNQNAAQANAQQSMMNDIMRMRIQGQQAVAATPSDFDTAMGRVGGIMNDIGKGATAFSGFLPVSNSLSMGGMNRLPQVFS